MCEANRRTPWKFHGSFDRSKRPNRTIEPCQSLLRALHVVWFSLGSSCSCQDFFEPDRMVFCIATKHHLKMSFDHSPSRGSFESRFSCTVFRNGLWSVVFDVFWSHLAWLGSVEWRLDGPPLTVVSGLLGCFRCYRLFSGLVSLKWSPYFSLTPMSGHFW